MQRLILLLLAFHSVPALGQYQYYGAPNDGMGAMSSMPPAPPPVSAPPTYPGYGSDMSYGSPGYPSDSSFNASSAPNILSYGFLEGGYQYQQPKDSSLEGSHGVALALSVQLFKPLFIRADFGWSLSNGGGRSSREYDFTSASLGAGLYLPIVDKFHLLAEVGGMYGKLDANINRFSFTEGAIYARPALRFAPVDFLELQAGFTVTSSDSFDTMIFDVAAYFRVLSQLDLGINVDLGDEFTGFTGGIRFRW
ncbi:MAG: hypothetical protein QE274_15125 [Verrucomicrobiaceae bacterium]|nr:hypothetical protein [Verrucomicrobiaceae bacterium]